MKSILREEGAVFRSLEKGLIEASLLVISGLPGVGKSLYILECQKMARALNKNLVVIQWDVARKAFESKKILEQFPMGDGTIHNGVKLSLGQWLLSTLKEWNRSHVKGQDVLLIEAPLVGHRFVELAKEQSDRELEDLLNRAPFFIPIPSIEVREKIEADRAAQVAEDAIEWMGAKPSVMLKIWKMICGIANEMGMNVSMEGQPDYDPEVYEFVFSKVLKYRKMIPLVIDELYDLDIQDEKELHIEDSLKASDEEAMRIALSIKKQYGDYVSMDGVVDGWWKH